MIFDEGMKNKTYINMNLKVSYLGLELDNPIILSSSPFTSSVERIVKAEQAGAGAVVLKSVFEEQILGEAVFLERYNDYPEAADYLHGYVSREYLKGHLDMIAETKRKVAIPVIASINCDSAGRWAEYAKSMESAGADALELNIFILPTNTHTSSREIEERYYEIVESVAGELKIPVTVKLGSRFTNLLAMCRGIYCRGAKGAVMFNRFFEPDIDIETMTAVSSSPLSERSELRNNLRWVAMASAEVPTLDFAVTTGVHTGEDAVKAILAGAKTVNICTALFLSGLEVVGDMKTFISEWMVRHDFKTIPEFCGKLYYKGDGDKEVFQRMQYMKFFPKM